MEREERQSRRGGKGPPGCALPPGCWGLGSHASGASSAISVQGSGFLRNRAPLQHAGAENLGFPQGWVLLVGEKI